MKTYAVIFMFAFSTLATAMMVKDMDYTCPVDGTEFTQMTALSGTSFGNMLDLMPYGPTYGAWPVPKCPADGFMMYKKFSTAELKKLKPYIMSAEYQKMQKEESPYYLIYNIKKKLGENDIDCWYTLLQATWEAGARYDRYATEALALFDTLLNSRKTPEKIKTTLYILSGELNRRIKNFNKAEQIFEALEKRPLTKDDEISPTLYEAIIRYQLELIANKDNRPQKIPESKN